MTDPVDLTHLRELTGGDKEMESMLYDLFVSTSDECIADIESNATEGHNDVWRKQTHALKGSALNVGANDMAQVCSVAQDNADASAEQKAQMLADIKNHYDLVKAFLEGELH